MGCFPDPWGSDSWGCRVQGQGVAFPENMALERAPILGNIIYNLTVNPRVTRTHSVHPGHGVCCECLTKPEITNWRLAGWVFLTGAFCSLNT